ncbi:MAG TPA: carboxypeptidase regulatory-like domain-containing protein, partial [Opitutus sp.]|nr:carboxypeptidase regulatory-like domain-containing protein [Opitutus sp.]
MNHPAVCPLARSRIVAFLRLIVLSFLPFLASSLLAQSEVGSLSGKVTDASSQTALSGALVRIVGTEIEAATDREGNFWFSSLPAGSHTVRVSYLGLDARDFPVTITAGSESTLQAKLGDEIVRLSAFTVSGQREGQARALNEQRASDNLKSIVSSDALGRFPDQNAAETLGRISGVSLARDQG